MLGALHPGDLSDQDGLELTSVEMAPSPLSLIITGTGLATRWTLQLAAPVLHCDFDLIVCEGDVDIGHLPRLLYAQYLAV